MTGAPGIVVVKLGGSLAGSRLLRPWLSAVAAATRGRAVLVPGGGPFADTVRDWQPRLGIDDVAAHLMAALGMAQFGVALASLHPDFQAADSVEAILRALASGMVPVWLPWPMLREAPALAASWDVTSDSIALWLAVTLGAASVLLVKQAEEGSQDLVDVGFAGWRGRFPGQVNIAGPADLPAVLDPDRLPGIPWP